MSDIKHSLQIQRDEHNQNINAKKVDLVGDALTYLKTAVSLTQGEYDYVDLSYTGSNLTGVVFKIGGSTGTTVSTLTLGYDSNDNLTSVTKS